MEKAFVTVFTIAVIVFGLSFIGLFLLIVKIVLAFIPEVRLMGLTIK